MKVLSIFLIFISMAACVLIRPLPKTLIDIKDTHYWEGIVNDTSFKLFLGKSSGIWFNGYLIKENNDTLRLIGFQKGTNHYTQVYRIKNADTTHLGSVFIWKMGRHADSANMINDMNESIAVLPNKIMLFKKKKETL